MQALGYLIFLGVGLIQLFAIMDGLQAWLGLPSVLAFIVALLTTYFPLVGQALGVYGAIVVWGWPWWLAVCLFFGSLILFLGLGGIAAVVDRFRSV